MTCAEALPWSAASPKPPDRLGVVLRNPRACVVHDPEVDLRRGVALVGREPKPPDRLGVVLRNPRAGVVHDPEVELRRGVALVGREPKPPDRLGVVLRDTPAGVVHHAEQNLRTGVSLLSQRAQLVELRRLRLHRRTGRERDQDGDGGNERLHAALLKRNAV